MKLFEKVIPIEEVPEKWRKGFEHAKYVLVTVEPVLKDESRSSTANQGVPGKSTSE